MACNCTKAKGSVTWQYTDKKGNVYTGTQLEMRAKQIREGNTGTLVQVASR